MASAASRDRLVLDAREAGRFVHHFDERTESSRTRERAGS